jgi:hypothetical protein
VKMAFGKIANGGQCYKTFYGHKLRLFWSHFLMSCTLLFSGPTA